MNILCFDIGGTQIKSMIKNENEEIGLANIKSRAKDGALLVKDDIFASIHQLKEKYEIHGIAISTAGMVDPKTQTIAYANDNFKDYIGFDWKKLIEDEFKLNAVVENDVKSAALGEYYYGAGKGYDSMFALTVGTGIGGALIIDGQIYRGASGQAGEIGYLPMKDNIFEKISSTTALINRAKDLYPEKNYSNGIEIFEAIDKNEPEAIELIDHMTENLARGIANIMLIVSPSIILIGGGISEQKDKFLDPIRQKVKNFLPENVCNSTTIINTNLGNKSGLYGAYQLYLDKIEE